MNVTTITMFVTLCGPYYACGYTGDIFQGPIYSFAVLYTENLAFQCVTLQSEYIEYRGCTSVATLCTVFRTIFFSA